MLSPDVCSLLERLDAFASDRNYKIWLVGGAVRDGLLSFVTQDSDLDLVIEGDLADFVSQFAVSEGCDFKKFNQFRTAKLTGLKCPLESLDLASLRTEKYERPGALPIVEAGNFQQDYQRRDFTINALYLPLADFIGNKYQIDARRVIDLSSGLKDLEAKQIKVLHKASFLDDPTRLFRAVRYAVKISGALEADTKSLFDLALNGSALNTISRQRILNEIRKTCQLLNWKETIQAFIQYGLIENSALIFKADLDRLKLIVSVIKHEPFESFCSALYFLNRDQQLFNSFGLGKKFFQKAKNSFHIFERILEDGSQ